MDEQKTIGRAEFLDAKKNLEKGYAVLPDGTRHYCRGLTAREWGEIQDQTHRIENNSIQIKNEFRLALVVSAAALNPDGTRAYGASDIGALNELPVAWLQPIADRIMELSGLTVKQHEDAVKNSPQTPA